MMKPRVLVTCVGGEGIMKAGGRWTVQTSPFLKPQALPYAQQSWALIMYLFKCFIQALCFPVVKSTPVIAAGSAAQGSSIFTHLGENGKGWFCEQEMVFLFLLAPLKTEGFWRPFPSSCRRPRCHYLPMERLLSSDKEGLWSAHPF